MTGRRGRRPITARRRIVGGLSWLLALALAVGWAVFLRPASLGGPAGYVIVSGESMEPMLHTGDLAVVRQQQDYRVGDVVAYKIPKDDVGGGMLVIHRVIGGTPTEGLVLQGDNRDTRDMWRPRAADVVGTLQWYIPHAGTALFLLKTPLVLAGVIGFLGFWVVITLPDRRREADEDAVDEPDEQAGVVQPDPIVVPAPPARPARPRRDRSADVAVAAVAVISVAGYLAGRSKR